MPQWVNAVSAWYWSPQNPVFADDWHGARYALPWLSTYQPLFHIFCGCSLTYGPCKWKQKAATKWFIDLGSRAKRHVYILSKKRNAHVIQQEFFQVWSLYDWDNDIWLKSAICQKSNLFVNLLLCETGVCSGPLSATRSITCVATSCFLHCSASAWHGWNQTCNLCMWDVIPGLLDSQTQLWEGLRRWVTWPYASINKVPQMLDRGQVGGICWPGLYLDSISSQKVLCEAGRVRASIILLKR